MNLKIQSTLLPMNQFSGLPSLMRAENGWIASAVVPRPYSTFKLPRFAQGNVIDTRQAFIGYIDTPSNTGDFLLV